MERSDASPNEACPGLETLPNGIEEIHLLKGSSHVFVASALGAVATFLSSVVIARVLGVTEFGIFSLLLSLQSMIVLVSTFGIPRACAKFIPEHAKNDEEGAAAVARFGMKLAVTPSAACFVAYVLLSDAIGTGLYGQEGIADLILLSGIMLLSTSVLALISGVAQGYQQIDAVSLIAVAKPVLSFVIVCILIFPLGITGVFLGYAIGQSLVSIGVVRFLSGRIPWLIGAPVRPMPKKGRFEFVGFSVLSLLASLTAIPAIWIGNTILAIWTDIESVGYLAIAYGMYNIFMMIPGAMVIPLLPRISELFALNSKKVKDALLLMTRATSFILFPLLFAGSLFSQEIITSVYGSSYANATKVVSFLLAACYLNSQSSLLSTAYIGIGKMREFLFLQSLWAVSFIALVLCLVPQMGVDGIGTSFLVAHGLLLTFASLFSGKLLGVKSSASFLRTIIGSLVIASGFLLAVDLDVSFPLRLIIFGGSMVAFAAVRRKESVLALGLINTAIKSHGNH